MKQCLLNKWLSQSSLIAFPKKPYFGHILKTNNSHSVVTVSWSLEENMILILMLLYVQKAAESVKELKSELAVKENDLQRANKVIHIFY